MTASRQAERIISNQHLTGIVPYTNVVVARAAALNNAQAALDMKLAQLLAAVALIEVLRVGWEASQLPRWEYVNELSLLDLSPMLPPVACRGRNCGDSGSLPVFGVQPSYQSAANGAWAVMCDGIFR